MLTGRERRLIAGLAKRRNREREGLFLVEGPRVVEDLLASRIEPRIVALASTFADTPEGAALAADAGARAAVRILPDRELARLARTRTPQGVLAVAAVPEHGLETLRAGARGVHLALDGVQDPGNVGTLIRTAEALGAAGVVSLPGTADVWSPKVVRAAAGALFRLPVVRAEPGPFFGRAEAEGLGIVVADAAGTSIRALEPPPAGVVLVLGNEGAGAGEAARAAAARVVAIPQRPGAESLNVAAAGAILLWELIGEEAG